MRAGVYVFSVPPFLPPPFAFLAAFLASFSAARRAALSPARGRPRARASRERAHPELADPLLVAGYRLNGGV